MNNTIEYNFINPELNEINNNINKTIKCHIIKYGKSYWKRFENKYNIRFLDKKKKTKNITIKQGMKRTIIASNVRYEYIEKNEFIILIQGDIKKML